VSRIQRFRPTGALVAAGAVLGAVALAGCSAGQITQTDTQLPAVVGANGGVGTMVVRDAYIEFGEQAHGANIYPRGGAAPLKMSIVNTGGQPDRLVSASSPAASSVTISGDADVPPGRVLLIEGEPAAAPAATPSGAPRPSPGATPAPSAEPAAPGDEIGGAGVEQGQRPTVAPPTPPVGEAPLAGQREGQMVLTGLTEDVRAGLTYPLVLNFERAGQVTLDVPVGYPSEPREDEPVE
jgi:copper(I)-binding protein